MDRICERLRCCIIVLIMETGLSFPHLMCVYSVQDVTFRESTGGATPIPEATEQRWSAGTGAGAGDGDGNISGCVFCSRFKARHSK